MAYEEDELPVLNDVVKTGNESIIQSTRLEREVDGEIEQLRHETIEFDLPSHLKLGVDVSDVVDQEDELDMAQIEDRLADGHGDRLTDRLANRPAADMAADLEEIEGALIVDLDVQQSVEDELELLIDDIVDRHVTSLRRDLRALLERANRLRP